MRVYVKNQRNEPLMPTIQRKARLLLKQKKAKIIDYNPFTIQLLYATGETKQEIVLGVDAGSKTIGISATTDKSELFSAELQLRADVVELLATKRQFRHSRRGRKTRYRQPRFQNRKKSKGWLAPSIENKIATHLKVVTKLHNILPVTKIIVEVASFDIQKIKNPNIQGVEYLQGDKLGFWNTREYVLFRDGHKCHGKKGCINKKLKVMYPQVNLTYGYITKNTRITNNLPKERRIDALCITENVIVKRLDNWYFIKQVRKKKRSLHESIARKGRKKPNITAKRNSKNTKQIIS